MRLLMSPSDKHTHTSKKAYNMQKKHKARPRGFAGARLALWLATLVLACFGALGWCLALWDASPSLAIAGSIVALVAPVSAAALTGPAMHGAGVYAWACILIFTAMDAGSNANAAWQLDAAANGAANGAALSEYYSEAQAAREARDAATAALLALPTPSATGDIRNANTYAIAHAALTANLQAAEQRLANLKAPEAARLFPQWLSGAVMALTSLALILGHLAVNKAARAEVRRVAKEAAEASAQKAPRKRRLRKQRSRKALQGPNVIPVDFSRRGDEGPVVN